MNLPDNKDSQLYGLYELELDGTVRYSLARRQNTLRRADSDQSGSNFFEKIAVFRNAEELRGHFQRFSRGPLLTECFAFHCNYDGKSVPIKVMMSKAYQSSCLEPAKIIILDIRKVCLH